MTIFCRLCGKKANEINGYLERVNPKGEPMIAECRPSCNCDLPKETVLLMAIEGADDNETKND